MSEIVIHGFPASTYTRTVRLAAEEKGLAYRMADPEMGMDAYLALHPFGKMPAMSHGAVHLFETFSIARYFAGAEASIADLFYTPMVAYLPAMPEGGKALAKCPNIQAWQERMSARNSFAETQPQLAA